MPVRENGEAEVGDDDAQVVVDEDVVLFGVGQFELNLVEGT